jgi:hypothetical protein
VRDGNAANVLASVLPAGAATSALQSSMITALGAPFQAGGSLGNTSFGISGGSVSPAAAATGGASPSSAIAPATPAGVNLKASAGTVYDIHIGNIGSAAAWVKVYDSASAPTCGSGTPVGRHIIPANSAAANGSGNDIVFPLGKAFASGIGYCVTALLPDADTTALTANTVAVNFDWK